MCPFFHYTWLSSLLFLLSAGIAFSNVDDKYRVGYYTISSIT